MEHILKKLKRVTWKGASGRQTQQKSSPAAPSATGSNQPQQQQSRNSFPSASHASRQQPLAAQSLWDQAYDALAKEMPGLVEDYEDLLAKEHMASSAPDATTHMHLPAPHGFDTHFDRSPRQVQLNTVIQNGLQRMEDNKTTFKIAGREIVLEDQITKATSFLLWGKDWIGNAVRCSPEASLIWSGVSLILPLLTNSTTAAEANQDGFAYVTSRMCYYVALEPTLRQLGQNARVDEALISAANDHIVDLYQTILNFQLSSVLRFYQSRLKTYVSDTVSLKDWNRILLCIKTQEETVNSVLGQINDLAARETLEILNKSSEVTRATLQDCLSVAKEQLTVSKEHLTVTEKQLAAQEDEKQERLLAEQRKCLQELCLTENGKGVTYEWYKSRVDSRVEGTCKWLLQHEHYQKWLLQESGPLLVSADPGCGKSVLAKYLIDHELAQLPATTCYFFFKDQDQNTIRQALCALLHQLFSAKLALIQHAMELYNKRGDKLVQSEESLWTILRNAMHDPQAGPVIFVVDALDECAESELSSLITNLEDMFSDQQLADAKFKVLMTSRPYQQVVNEFYSLQDTFQHIRIPGEEQFEAISQEINSVIQHRVKQLAKKHQLSDGAKSSLNSKLLAIEHRTYLWVYLVFNYLDEGFNEGFKKTEDGINAAIQELPEGVNQAYDRILNRSRKEKTVKTVKTILSIILAARRPLTLSEMNIAMNLDGQGRGQSIYDLDLDQDVDIKSRLRALCGLFVTVHHDRIYFLHQTAREFLIQSSAPTTVSSNLQWHHSITTRHAHSVLAEICMFYLDRLNFTHTETFHEEDQHGALVHYSTQYWSNHFREAAFEESFAMVDLALELCTPSLTSHSQWASIVSSTYHTSLGSSTDVLVATYLGLTPVTELLLSRGADIEAKTSDGSTVLMRAAIYGQEATTRLLLEKGADIEAKDDFGSTALMNAAGAWSVSANEANEAVIRLLLDKGADIEARNNCGQTALMQAAEYGHEARLLLDKGADIEARDDGGWTALMLAAARGHEGITRLLLDKGADIETREDFGRTALMLAAARGCEAVTRLLLENDTDVKAKNNLGLTALILAAARGHEGITRLLLDKGADIETRDDFGRTALMLAAERGCEAVTRLLLENGTDVEAKNNVGSTSLILAAAYGHEAVTRLLLDKGADIEARDDGGWTALMLAAARGREAVTRLLLDKGADIEARDDGGWTALMLAAARGREAVTRLLLDKCADIETRSGIGRTALMLAAAYGHEAVTRLLLGNGADIETRDDFGRTALMLAAARGHEAVTRLLLGNGADVEAEDNFGLTALILAAANAHEAVARLLLDKGADVEARDDNGWTALMHAAARGREAVTRLLLENGTDVEAKNNRGLTAFMLAAANAHEAVKRLLRENSAGIEARDNNGWAASMPSAARGHEGVEKGAGVKAKNNRGLTALMLAAAEGHDAVPRMLLDTGGDVEDGDSISWPALGYAPETTTQLLPDDGTQGEAKDVEGGVHVV